MLLAIDIGNSDIFLGCFDGEQLLFDLHLKSDLRRPADEYRALLVTLLNPTIQEYGAIQSAIISSVVPPLTTAFVTLVQGTFAVEPIIVGQGVRSGIALKVSEPSQLGPDRIANAVAVKRLYGVPAVVVDCSTATTIDYVGPDGGYEGIIIAPGLAGSLEYLVNNTSALPRVDLAWPKNVLGKTSKSAMQSGLLIGFICMIDGLLDRLTAEVGEVHHFIATGQHGSFCVPHSRRVKSYDPHLTLKGLRLIAALNQGE